MTVPSRLRESGVSHVSGQRGGSDAVTKDGAFGLVRDAPIAQESGSRQRRGRDMTGQARIIDGKAAAAELRAGIAREIAAIKAARGLVPGLHVVLVGDDPASKVYVASKEKLAVEVGMA